MDAPPDERASGRLLDLLPWMLLGVLGLTVVGAWAWALGNARSAAAERERLLAEQTALRIGDWMNARLQLLESVRRLEEAGEYDAPGEWTQQLTIQTRVVGGFQAVNWLEPDGRIVRVAPLAGNEAALGRSVYDHPDAGPVLADAVATGQLRITAPLELFQGGRGVTAYLPSVSDGVLRGTVNGVFRTDHLEAALLRKLSATHAIGLWDQGEPLLVPSPSAPPTLPGHRVDVPVGDRRWTLELTPLRPAVPLSQALPSLVVGLLLVLALAAAAHRIVATTRREQHARLQRAGLAARLERSERLEALGRLAGGLAHDFNNVLTVVMGSAELIDAEVRSGHAPSHVVLSHADRIRDASERASQLTRQLLAFARREPVDDGAADAAAHLREIAPMLDNLATEAVTLDVDGPPDGLWVACSPSVLDRILVNLVSNARDAMPPHGGRITIQVSEDADGVAIEVRDNGSGMPPEVASRVFEPLFTTRDGGNGLGLASVYGLVTQRGGTIDVRSAVGVGSTFRVWLPRGAPGRHDTRPSPGEDASGPPLSVLLVEDDDAVRRVVEDALARRGVRVRSHADPASALADDEPADVLVTDLVMPGGDGATLAMRMREKRPDMGVVIMTGYPDPRAPLDDALRIGANLLGKPLDLEALLQAIRDAAQP